MVTHINFHKKNLFKSYNLYVIMAATDLFSSFFSTRIVLKIEVLQILFSFLSNTSLFPFIFISQVRKRGLYFLYIFLSYEPSKELNLFKYILS